MKAGRFPGRELLGQGCKAAGIGTRAPADRSSSAGWSSGTGSPKTTERPGKPATADWLSSPARLTRWLADSLTR